jgi:hypothetical protein
MTDSRVTFGDKVFINEGDTFSVLNSFLTPKPTQSGLKAPQPVASAPTLNVLLEGPVGGESGSSRSLRSDGGTIPGAGLETGSVGGSVAGSLAGSVAGSVAGAHLPPIVQRRVVRRVSEQVADQSKLATGEDQNSGRTMA